MLGLLQASLWGINGTDPAAARRWYIVSVRPNFEKRVHEELVQKGIESFLPLVEEVHPWSDRKKQVTVPLLPGYEFAVACST